MKARHALAVLLIIPVLSCSKAMMGGQDNEAEYVEMRGASVALDSDPQSQAEWSRMEATAANALYKGKSYRILNTNVEMKVERFTDSLAGVKKIVKEVEGQISTTESRQDDEGLTSGLVEVKVPADRYDEALKRISALGEVRYMEEKSEDVTKEFVDLSARLDNARKLEARILQILETQTGTIQDVMNVEKELAAVREKIEEMEGRKRYLENKIQYSTITVRMYEKGAKWGGDVTAGEVFKEIVNKVGIVFVGSLGILIVAVVGAAPWLAVLVVLALIIRSLVKRKKKTGSAAQAPTSGGSAP
jgi:phage shock protein A